MMFSIANKHWRVALCFCLVASPIISQEKDTTQPAPAQDTVQTTVPVVQPALEYPPAQQCPPATGTPLAQQTVPAQSDYFSGRVAGEFAGKSAAVGAGWVLLGCVGGVLWAYVLEPDVATAEALMGKSGEYIAGYGEGYRKEVKARRVKKSFAGCIIFGAAYIAIYIVGVVMTVSIY